MSIIKFSEGVTGFFFTETSGKLFALYFGNVDPDSCKNGGRWRNFDSMMVFYWTIIIFIFGLSQVVEV